MLKKIKWTLIAISIIAMPLLAEDLPKASVDLSATFVSDYVWRGKNLMASSYASQRGTQEKSADQAWAFQPNINFNTPVEGLYFGIWGNFALSHRENLDTDGLLQQGPGGSSLLLHEAADKVRAIDLTSLSNANATTNLQSRECESAIGTTTTAASCVPGYYKENNGLKSFDEIDYSFGYSRETTIGTLGAGILYYTFPGATSKADAAEEVFISYALPQLPELTLTYYTDVTSGTKSASYANLAYASSLEINKMISLSYGAGVGYGIQENKQGVQDVTASIGIDIQGFSISLNGAHRPAMRFVDADAASGGDNLPMYLIGGSTNADGLIQDQSKSVGAYNVLVNAAIQAAIDASPIGPGVYTYTPRQKLPSEVYWVSIGYTYSI